MAGDHETRDVTSVLVTGLRGDNFDTPQVFLDNFKRDGDFSTKLQLFLVHKIRRSGICKMFEYLLIFWEGRAVK